MYDLSGTPTPTPVSKFISPSSKDFPRSESLVLEFILLVSEEYLACKFNCNLFAFLQPCCYELAAKFLELAAKFCSFIQGSSLVQGSSQDRKFCGNRVLMHAL